MARETTRRVNRQVVEVLEEAATAGERSHMEWNLVLSRMTVLSGLTPLHKDLVDDAWSASAKLGDYRENLLRRLRAERDGDGR
jgi:hypothetical protein